MASRFFSQLGQLAVIALTLGCSQQTPSPKQEMLATSRYWAPPVGSFTDLLFVTVLDADSIFEPEPGKRRVWVEVYLQDDPANVQTRLTFWEYECTSRQARQLEQQTRYVGGTVDQDSNFSRSWANLGPESSALAMLIFACAPQEERAPGTRDMTAVSDNPVDRARAAREAISRAVAGGVH